MPFFTTSALRFAYACLWVGLPLLGASPEEKAPKATTTASTESA
ncbi:MAG: hypothetical protein RIT19_2268, partial [Verrucomicrobiota bacterium]